ncbi:MAG: LysR family transcriptional regulator [Alphaproteobacteria bacterium]|nr:LysR family transcriptional regulator [Alphaproteobacteria bacterium]MBU6471848.1 LysR family transcriptional regulator [Alphaproteobacteria bacterium]MDE2012035.1 LysR family transcriptional regulator [Alphaproteobacteria bacterium]MDE2073863.1 LysR family transcriptional regulator [Alphaproteobacteria bacterium]MDE2350518.1 LysR family transcriptional regulator [Alphaproteobacteria bacterium]
MNDASFADNVELNVPKGVDWDDFRVFLEVVRHGSFNRAAARLKMTQPTVSRRLVRLEQRIGVRLFERDRRGPRLTVEGQRIFQHVNEAQSALIRAASQASNDASAVEGDCRLLMGDGLAAYWLTRFLPGFFRSYPKVNLKVFGALDGQAERSNRFDLHLYNREAARGGANAARLATMHFLPFASRDYLRENGTPHSAADLRGHRLLDQAGNLTDIVSWANWAVEGAVLRTALFTNLTTCLVEAVYHGVGIALLPSFAMLPDDKMVPLDIGIRIRAPVVVGVERAASGKWAVRAMLAYLRETVFNPDVMPWFRDEYLAPQPEWAALCTRLVREAGVLVPQLVLRESIGL